MIRSELDRSFFRRPSCSMRCNHYSGCTVFLHALAISHGRLNSKGKSMKSISPPRSACRGRVMARSHYLGLLFAICTWATPHAGAVTCGALVSLNLDNTRIDSAISITAGSYTPPNMVTVAQQVAGVALTNLPAFCRVVGTISPSIQFELWLPDAAVWNGKFTQSGSGGLGGYINYTQGATSRDGMALNLRRGYAAAATNQGHAFNTTDWMLDPGLLVDWAYRANHEVAVRAKSIIASYYGSAPRLSYFEGCSVGGVQGLMAAQRYPLDFDGIVAGAPVASSPSWVYNLWVAHALYKQAGASIPPAKLPVIYNAALATCDANDGLRDGIISDPETCMFDPNVLLCSTADNANCLKAPQLQALNQLYGGARNPRTGAHLSPGFSVGSEPFWTPFVSVLRPQGSAVSWYTWAVFEDPAWNWKTFDFDADYQHERTKLASIISTEDPDLRPFRDHGGKLLMWQGWADATLPPQWTVDYYKAMIDVVAAEHPNGDGLQLTQDFARLFMNPGVAHCTGGVGADNFDPVGALEKWVEQGLAPERIVATKFLSGAVQFTRPLCAYPAVPIYDGGDPHNASSFVCR